jgi:hypothetical protein
MKDKLLEYYPIESYEINIHRWVILDYNPEGDTRYNIVITILDKDLNKVVKLFSNNSFISYEHAENYILEQLKDETN